MTGCDGKWYKRLALRSAAHMERREALSALPRSLDGIDQAIIEALQKNGREPFRRIAADVGVSEATIRARYTRLCEDNILQVTGVTNPLGLGFDAMAMVGIRTAARPSRWPTRSPAGTRPATSSSRRASSTSSSSSSAPTAGSCST